MGLLSAKEQPLTRIEQYQVQMDEALRRARTARLQMAEATTVDELDIGKAALQAAYAEVSRIVRLAKQEVGTPIRPVQEVEEQYRKMVKRFRTGGDPAPQETE